jgi:ferredoxin
LSSTEERIKSIAIERRRGAGGYRQQGKAGRCSTLRQSELRPALSPFRHLYRVALDKDTARGFLSKKDWRSHCAERKRLAQTLYHINDRLMDFLESQGYQALGIDINNNYRPEEGAADVTEMTEFHPVFSHRYAAVAAGVGRLGWSGNVLAPGYGALLELSTVVTSAELQPDPLLAENPCDKCKICAAACPVGMMSAKEHKSVTVAGITDEIAVKRPNTCCWIGCTGYHGLAASRKWSNWSPYRLGAPLPQDKGELDRLNIQLQKADPQMSLDDNSYADYRRAMFDPEWFTNTVCGNCRLVCWPERRDREENLRLLRQAGVVALGLSGEHIVTSEDEVMEIDTPYLVRVGVLKSEYDTLSKPDFQRQSR